MWSGAAVSAAVTRTKPSKTLFIASVHSEVNLSDVEGLFAAQPGFIRWRTHRRMGFCDFMTEFHSASAMRCLQGHVVNGHPITWVLQTVGDQAGTITRFPVSPCSIDYDKDPESKKEKVVERQRTDEELKRQLATADPYFCALCSVCCLHLSKACSLAALPKRGTDGSSVVDEATQLRRLSVVRGPPRAVRREKGVERQFPVHCPACDVPIGYRPAPLDEPARFLYIYDGALKADKRSAVDVASLLGATASVAPNETAAGAPPNDAAVVSLVAPVHGSEVSGVDSFAPGGAGAAAAVVAVPCAAALGPSMLAGGCDGITPQNGSECPHSRTEPGAAAAGTKRRRDSD